ncbi:hypothetical protein [Legionella gresilensis]|uniref:hypothetical protein n=1 Tax=Legionella gresilensis TaxID=91823 RepID=UPI001A93FB1D|nr:hypothetical protein [Legionella gresilensis]
MNVYRFNHYSIALIIAYILAYIVMQIDSQSSWYEGLSSLPFIALAVIWSEKIIKQERAYSDKIIIFKRDMFIVSYGCLLAFVTSLIFQSNNVDARSWWPVIIILGAIYAILFGFIFAIFARLLKDEHSSYSKTFATVLFVGYAIITWLPPFISFNYFGQVNSFTLFMILLFGFHIMLSLGYWLNSYFSAHKG